MPSRLLRPIPWATLRVRLTLLNTAVVLLATIAALVAVRLAARSILYREADSVLRGDVREISMALEDLHPNRQAVIEELRRKTVGHRERGWFAQLLDGNGKTIWKSDNCPDVIAAWPLQFEKKENLVPAGGYRFARRTVTPPGDESFHVRIGMPTAFLEQDVDALSRILIPVGIALSLLTPLAGYWLALRATSPIAEILRTADQLRPTRLGDRLEVRGTKDELDRLSLTINRLLDQVAGYVDRQQQFVADAAHELRGPLAAIQTNLEVAASRDRSTAEYRDTIEEVLDETRQLSRLTNDLLTLAEGESPTDADMRTSVDWSAIASQTAAMFSGVAEDRSIRLAVNAPQGVIVWADARQLRQVLSNLVDNAIRFTPAGGSVIVSLRRDSPSATATLTVEDTGCGMEPRHLPRVFDRFFKADDARDRGAARRGGGLGLAICRSIVERHGGRIGVHSEVGRGSAFTVTLPAAPHLAQAAAPLSSQAG